MADSPAQNTNELPKKITFRFCRECANLLYPREDKNAGKLEFACRTCYYSEDAETTCIFRNELSNTVGDTAGITQDIGEDPTLPRITKECPACKEHEAVFFQSQQRTAETGMKLYFVCTHCGHVWQ